MPYGFFTGDYLKGREGDRANAVLAAAGYNFSLLLRWLEDLLRALFPGSPQSPLPGSMRLKIPQSGFFTDDWLAASKQTK